MKSLNSSLFALILGVAVIAIPGTANATSYIFLKVYDSATDTSATTWKYKKTIDNPVTGNDCYASGSNWHEDGYLETVDLSPKFVGGNFSRTRYVALCKDGWHFLVLSFTIKYSCFSIICDTKFSWEQASKRNVKYTTQWKGGTNQQLNVTIEATDVR